jgi:hypothetical protein
VDERRRLEGVIGPLAPDVVRGEIAQLAVNDGDQMFERRPIALTNGAEQPSDIAVIGGSHKESRGDP